MSKPDRAFRPAAMPFGHIGGRLVQHRPFRRPPFPVRYPAGRISGKNGSLFRDGAGPSSGCCIQPFQALHIPERPRPGLACCNSLPRFCHSLQWNPFCPETTFPEPARPDFRPVHSGEPALPLPEGAGSSHASADHVHGGRPTCTWAAHQRQTEYGILR